MSPATTSSRKGSARNGPYAEWAADGFYQFPSGEPVEQPPADLIVRQAAHGYTKEELAMVLKPMATEGYEPTFSMGDDSPLPPLAGRPRPIHHYVKQRFAQVTNPPIDPLRERLVMSLRMLLGPRSPLLTEQPDAARLLALDSFFLFPSAIDALQRRDLNPFTTVVLDATFDVSGGPPALETAVRDLAARAESSVAGGAGVLIIDDGAVGPTRAAIPSLLACGAVHHKLTEVGTRCDTSLVVVTDDARDVHYIAALLGYGADAVCPRLAFETVAADADESESENVVSPEAQDRFRAAAEAGVLKILSKMGISTSTRTAAPRSSRCSASTPPSSTCASPAHRRSWGASVGTYSARTCSPCTDKRSPKTSTVDLSSPGYFRVRKGGEAHGLDKDTVQTLNDLTLVQEAPPLAERDPMVADMAAAHLLQRAIAGGSDETTPSSPPWSTIGHRSSCTTLLEWRSDRTPIVDRRRRTGVRHREALLDRRDVARRAVEGGARDPRPGDEPDRRQVELR